MSKPLRCLEEIQQELDRVRGVMRPLGARAEALEHERSHVRSVLFIQANGITRAKVEMSAELPGGMQFEDITEYGCWLVSSGCSLPWASWNGRIYHITDLINLTGPGMPVGLVEDLPE